MSDLFINAAPWAGLISLIIAAALILTQGVPLLFVGNRRLLTALAFGLAALVVMPLQILLMSRFMRLGIEQFLEPAALGYALLFYVVAALGLIRSV